MYAQLGRNRAAGMRSRVPPRGFSDQSLASLEYWVARSSRAMTSGGCLKIESGRIPPKQLPPHRQCDQAERSDNDAPPCEQHKTVPCDVAQKRFHHDDRDDKGHHESDRDDAEVIGGH